MICGHLDSAIQRGRLEESSGGALPVGDGNKAVAEGGRRRRRGRMRLEGKLKPRGLQGFEGGRGGVFHEDAPRGAGRGGVGWSDELRREAGWGGGVGAGTRGGQREQGEMAGRGRGR